MSEAKYLGLVILESFEVLYISVENAEPSDEFWRINVFSFCFHGKWNCIFQKKEFHARNTPAKLGKTWSSGFGNVI